MAGKNTERIREIRRYKFRKNPRCHWCGIRTILWEKDSGIVPPNAATLDHIFIRSDPERATAGKSYKADHESVLACKQCNETRGKLHEAEMSWEERWKRSNTYPREFLLGMAPVNGS